MKKLSNRKYIHPSFTQTRHKDFAAGGAKTRRWGHIFKILYWIMQQPGDQTK